MHWNYKDQLRQIDLGGGGAAFYVYDASGQRVRKVWEKALGITEERMYLGGFEIFRRHGGPIGADTATLERETLHVMDDKQRIVLVETRTLDTAGNDRAPRQLIRYQFGNHLGSTTLELDDQAEIISHEEYTPYGSTSYQAARRQTETPNRYRYTGIERDEESGFGYHSTRYSAYWLGRWTSTDRAGLIDGSNLYRYSRNNPIRFHDPNGTDPPTRASRYSLGEFRLQAAHPVNDPLAHGAAFDLAVPGLFGLGATALNLGTRLTDNRVGQGFVNAGEFLLTGLIFYGPTVYSHEWGGHVGALERYGVSAEVKEFAWFSGSAGPTAPGGAAGLSVAQDAAVDAAGMNQQSINASVTYSRIARFGYFTPQDAVALFLGQAGTPAYAIRSLTRPPRPPNTDGDDINNYAGAPNSWSAGGIATASTLTALPAVAGLIYSAVQFIGYNQRSVEVPSLHFGSSGRLTFPNTQTLLTSSGAVIGASTVLSLGNDQPAFQIGIDVRPTSDFALALSARAYGLRFGGGRVEINPYLRLTAASSPGVFVGGELRLNPFRWLGVTGAIEGGVNDIRAEPEALPAGSTPGVRGRFGAVFSF
jgi:RHS repeat-associated protein